MTPHKSHIKLFCCLSFLLFLLKIFNDNVKQLIDANRHRRLFLDNECYNNILREVKEAQILRKSNQPLTTKHYRRLNTMRTGDADLRFYITTVQDG